MLRVPPAPTPYFSTASLKKLIFYFSKFEISEHKILDNIARKILKYQNVFTYLTAALTLG